MRNLQKYQQGIKKGHNNTLQTTEEKLAKIYQEMAREIEAELRLLESRWAAGDELVYSDLTKLGRLKKLQERINDLIKNPMKEIISEIDKLIARQATGAYLGGAWAVDQALGVNMDWGLIDVASVKAMINNKYKKTALKDLTEKSKQKINELITKGLLRGDSINTIAKNLRDVENLQDNYKRAVVIARTESHRAVERGRLEQYQYAKDELKINVKLKMLAVLDARTRPQSARMDGAESNDEGMFEYPNGQWYYCGQTGHPEWDINDRETTIEIVDDMGPMVRRSRSGGIMPFQTFGKWAEGQGIEKDIYGNLY